MILIIFILQWALIAAFFFLGFYWLIIK